MRTTLLIAAALLAPAALASPQPGDAPRVAQARPTTPATPASGDEDEEEPAPATPTSPPPAGTEKKDQPAAAPAAPAPAAPPAAADAEAMKLVSGAPLYNPNVAVHIVEQKPFSDSGKRELVIFPIAAQANGKFTQHLGSMGQFVWHLQENFGLQVTGGYNWYNSESSFNGELVDKFRIEAQAATSLLWTWGALGGVEVVPFYGKFAWFEGTLVQFSIVLNGGAGAGGTRHQLKPQSTDAGGTVRPATFGDTGVRFMGSLGAGFRLQLGSRFAFRLELRDVVYTARVERVNGCDVTDLRAMDAALRSGKLDFSSVQTGAGCQVGKFEGTDQNGNIRRQDVPLALALVKQPSSDVLNNVGVYVGASFLF